ncbi:MAG: hypothetical protein ABSG61_07330 [Gemmatimonadales bacterium]|jgi:hypothetical protein
MVVRARLGGVLAPAFAAAVLAAGCGDQPAAPKAVVGDVALEPGAYALYTGSRAAGPLRFPAAGTAGAEYLVVAQFATARADLSSIFSLTGSLPLTAATRQPSPASAPLPAAVRFHDAIRRMDEAAARASLRLGPPAAPPARAGPPAVGSQRTFRVCASLDCTSTATVTASAEVVGAHSAIYLDLAAPPGGFTTSDLEQLATQFDTVLYPLDTLAFGAPSDIDGNGVVIILLTPKVNALVGRPDCRSSFVSGFFLAADLAPATRASYNNGEVFYAMVPDPNGTMSCAHRATQVRQLIAPTFIHEFQHMISFNQHVLVRRGPIEALWLNEAMSHLAEELGGRHYDSVQADTETAARFLFGDLYNAYLYLLNPAANAVITTTGADGLEQRGAQWLFLRYLVDRYGAATTRRLEQTALTGDANVVAAAGSTGLAKLLGGWALALYVADLASFNPDPDLTYTHWRFRSTYDSLHVRDGVTFVRDFPLEPAAASGGSFAVSGTISSGSGSYLDIVLSAGEPSFTVTFTEPGGLALSGSGNPQLAIVRLR